MKGFRQRKLLRVEEVPAGPVDDLIGSVAEDVDNGIGAVEDVSIEGEIYIRSTSLHIDMDV